MLRKKRSKVLDIARARIASIKSIAENLDLGNGMTLTKYIATADRCDVSLDNYNTSIAATDGYKSVFDNDEAELADISDRFLAGIGALYGRGSDEYVKAGGTKKTSIRRTRLKKIDEKKE
jgi:hypothetical protein